MSRPTLEPSDKARLTAIEAQLHDIARGRPVRGGSFRDLADVFAIPIGHGDLLVYSRTAGGLVKVPVGANGRLLTADSAASGGVSWQPLPVHDHPHTHDLADYAGPTLRMSGLVAPSPNEPGENIEYGWHFQRIDHANPTYFTAAAGGNIITLVKAGRCLISFQFGWFENPPIRSFYATDAAYAAAAANFLQGDRWVHLVAGGQTVLDSHESPSGNATSCEGTTQTVLAAGATISASYQFYDRTLNVPAAHWPTVAESGISWPHLSVTYLGPN